MKKTEDMIWDYLDGTGSPEDRALVEDRLSVDQKFRELFLQSQVLHRNLQMMEPEMPALRFSQNVMDRLPAIRDLATDPLVSKKWMRIFSAGVLGMIVLIFGSSLVIAPQAADHGSTSWKIFDQFYSLFNYIPANTLLLGGTVGISILSLLLLDRWLQARFQRQSGKQA